LIHLLKYEHVTPAAHVLGKLLAEVIRGLAGKVKTERILVVPVPLYKRKRRQRGFNQSELIARVALKSLGSRQFVMKTGLLQRLRPTESQIGLTRHQRRENIRGAFGVPEPEEIAGQEVLLVDDVFTTGTTVAECARVLLRAGASKVWVATVARTQKLGVQAVKLPASETADDLAAAG
jgi:ComF family protein